MSNEEAPKPSDNTSDYFISNSIKIKEIKRVYKIDNALNRDPYNPNFDIKVSKWEDFVPKVGKQKIEEIEIRETPNEYAKYGGSIMFPAPKNSLSERYLKPTIFDNS